MKLNDKDRNKFLQSEHNFYDVVIFIYTTMMPFDTIPQILKYPLVNQQ